MEQHLIEKQIEITRKISDQITIQKDTLLEIIELLQKLNEVNKETLNKLNEK